MTRRSRSHRGFTLIELMVGTIILSIVGASLIRLLVDQTRFMGHQEAWRAARSVSRSSLNRVLSDLRMVEAVGGMESAAAGGKDFTVRVPYAFGVICSASATAATASLMPVDSAMFFAPGFSGFAWRNSAGVYTYVTAGATLNTAGTVANCTGANITTLAAFNGSPAGQVVNLGGTLAPVPPVGSIVFLFRRVRYEFKASTALPGSTGLWRTMATVPARHGGNCDPVRSRRRGCDSTFSTAPSPRLRCQPRFRTCAASSSTSTVISESTPRGERRADEIRAHHIDLLREQARLMPSSLAEVRMRVRSEPSRSHAAAHPGGARAHEPRRRRRVQPGLDGTQRSTATSRPRWTRFAVAQTGLEVYRTTVADMPGASDDVTLNALPGGSAQISLRRVRDVVWSVAPAHVRGELEGHQHRGCPLRGQRTAGAAHGGAVHDLGTGRQSMRTPRSPAFPALDKNGNSGALDGNDGCAGSGLAADPGRGGTQRAVHRPHRPDQREPGQRANLPRHRGRCGHRKGRGRGGLGRHRQQQRDPRGRGLGQLALPGRDEPVAGHPVQRRPEPGC